MFLQPLLKCSSEQQQLIKLILIKTVPFYIETMPSLLYTCNSKMLRFFEMTMVISIDQGLSIERVKKLHIDFTDNQKYL